MTLAWLLGRLEEHQGWLALSELNRGITAAWRMPLQEFVTKNLGCAKNAGPEHLLRLIEWAYLE
jgi:hypothetical protein